MENRVLVVARLRVRDEVRDRERGLRRIQLQLDVSEGGSDDGADDARRRRGGGFLEPHVAKFGRTALRLQRDRALGDGEARHAIEFDAVEAVDERIALELDLQDIPFAERLLDVRPLARGLRDAR